MINAIDTSTTVLNAAVPLSGINSKTTAALDQAQPSVLTSGIISQDAINIAYIFAAPSNLNLLSPPASNILLLAQNYNIPAAKNSFNTALSAFAKTEQLSSFSTPVHAVNTKV